MAIEQVRIIFIRHGQRSNQFLEYWEHIVVVTIIGIFFPVGHIPLYFIEAFLIHTSPRFLKLVQTKDSIARESYFVHTA